MEGREQRVAGFEHGDLRVREVELETRPECVVVDLGEGGRHLDGGAAADDDHVERPGGSEFRMGGRGLEAAEQVIPDPQRVFERLQREGVAAAPGTRSTSDLRPVERIR